MPSISVHLTLSSRIAERLGITDMPAYYLGAIAPDAVNLDGFASQELRYGAHIRSRDYNVWEQNISDFYKTNRALYADTPDFLTGFLMHLYTDIAWDEVVQPKMFEYLRSCGFADDELSTRKWDELRGFDSLLSQKAEYKNAIEELKKARPTAITTVTPGQLSKWRDKIVALEYPYPPAGFLCSEHIDLTAERALQLYFDGTE